MDRKFFNAQIERLASVYGAAKYPLERQDAIFEKLGRLQASEFQSQITRFIANSEKAPLLHDFEDAFASILGDLKQRELDEMEKKWEPCINCNGTGHMTFYSRTDGSENAFQCQCPRGPLLQPCFPKIYPGMEKEFASHRAYVAGRFDRIGTIQAHFNKGRSTNSDTPKHVKDFPLDDLEFSGGNQ